MSEPAHSISFRVDDTFVRMVADEGFGMKLTGTKRGTLAAFGLCLALGVMAIVRDSSIWWVLLFTVPGVLGLAVVGGIEWIRRKLRRSIAAQYAELPEPRTITVDLSDSGLRFTNSVQSQDVLWSQVDDIVMGERVWVIKLVGELGVPIPASAISSDARERLIAGRAGSRPQTGKPTPD